MGATTTQDSVPVRATETIEQVDAYLTAGDVLPVGARGGATRATECSGLRSGDHVRLDPGRRVWLWRRPPRSIADCIVRTGASPRMFT
jgi:hypothetical protein